MYSNIEEAWKSSNDLDKYRKDFHPVTRITDATNEINNNSARSSKILDNLQNSSEPVISSDMLSEISNIETVRRKINKPVMKQKIMTKKQIPVQQQKFKKMEKKVNTKPVVLINKKKHLDRSKSLSVSSQSHFDFETDLRDLAASIKKDDGSQCNKLFKHFQVCKKCRNTLIEKFSNDARPAIRQLANIGPQNSLDSIKYNLTESFVDLSKYTDVLKDKNNKNILSIILFGLLVIIILSMIYT